KNFVERFSSYFFPVFLLHLLEIRVGLKFRFLMRLRKSVPRANILADITSENPIFKFAPHPRGKFFFKFNGEIRNASRSVYHPWFYNSISRRLRWLLLVLDWGSTSRPEHWQY